MKKRDGSIVYPGLPEETIQKLCRLYLMECSKHMPLHHWRIPVDKKRNAAGAVIHNELKGFSDILVIYRGMFIAIECKNATNSLSLSQHVFRDLIKVTRGEYHVVRSVEDLYAVLFGIVASLARKYPSPEQSFFAAQDQLALHTSLENLLSKKRIQRVLSQQGAFEPASALSNAQARAADIASRDTLSPPLSQD